MNESSMRHDSFFVLVENRRVEVSLLDSEIGKTVELVLFTNDPHNPIIKRFTDDDGATFRHEIIGSPLTRAENDQQRIGLLRQALNAWRGRSAP